MPPIYNMFCEKCEKQLDIIRSIHDSTHLPTAEEEKEVGKCKPKKNPHTWVKKIGTFMLQKGRSWGGGKGFWLIPLFFLLFSGCSIFRPEPSEWTVSDHRKVMYACKSVCNGFAVKSYNPQTGECTCHKPNPSSADE